MGHAISNLALGVGQSFLSRREGVGHVFFIDHISKCFGPPHPILFDQSLTSRSSIVKNSTSISSVWQAIRAHYDFQSTGARFLDFSNITLGVNERPEDLFQRLMSFTEHNLLVVNGLVPHHGAHVTSDEELTPTLENMVVLR